MSATEDYQKFLDWQKSTGRSSVFGNTKVSPTLANLTKGIDYQDRSGIGGMIFGGVEAVPGAELTAADESGLGKLDDLTSTPWNNYFQTGIGLANTAMGIGSYFDTKKTNKLKRTALQGNIDEQANTRRDKDTFLGGTTSAFA